MKCHLLVVFALLGVCLGAHWNARNDPALFDSGYEYTLSKLPQSAILEQLPWSDTYWPSFESGIAHRWNAENPEDFSYKLHTKRELRKMKQAQLEELSPAEKFDIFIGRYDYPLVKEEWQRTHANDATWEGLCHGWAPASLWFKQPKPVVLKNRDGINVPFGSSDIKALLTFFTGQYDIQQSTKFVSERCNLDLDATPEEESKPECDDMNAATWHVLVTNEIGLRKQGFVIDRDRSIQVWNQPVLFYTYECSEKISNVVNNTVDNSTSSTNTTNAEPKSYNCYMTYKYGKEIYPQWQARPTLQIPEDYEYTLDVDADGKIVGGEFSSWNRPDFAWMSKIGDFYGYFEPLRTIYLKSTNSTRTGLEEHVRAPYYLNSQRLLGNSGQISMNRYSGHTIRKWSIIPEQLREDQVILITVKSLDTVRHRDTLRIYENKDGSGALIATLHGFSSEPIMVKVPVSSAFIVFQSDRDSSGNGFELSYEVLELSQ